MNLPSQVIDQGQIMSWAVALPLPVGAYDFGIPHHFVGPVPIGYRVVVPWQGEVRTGIVVGPGIRSSHQVRDALALLDDPLGPPWITPAFVSALLEEARYARIPLGLLIKDLVCVGLEPRFIHQVRGTHGADLSAFQASLQSHLKSHAETKVPESTWQSSKQFDTPLLDAIRQQGLLDEQFELVPETCVVIRANKQNDTSLTPKQELAWNWLNQQDGVTTLKEWSQGAGVSLSVVTGVLLRGWAERIQVPVPPPPLIAPGPLPTLSLDRLPEAKEWRLHGGRPKQRYRLLASRLAHLLDIGRSALIVVPDHFTLRRTWSHLSGLSRPNGLAVQLSGDLSTAEREHSWELIRTGTARLVIGTAMALGAPLSDLALIAVEEEGSDAYKLRRASGTFIPSLAKRIAEQYDCALGWIGCSPSTEVLDSPGIVLPAPPARLHVVDYGKPQTTVAVGPLSRSDLAPSSQGYPLSHDLARVLRQVAERGRQAVLLASRRGYSALLACSSCQHAPLCQHCDVTLRFYQEKRLLTCHQCGYREKLHDRCEKCGDPLWQTRGPGTEWIAGEVRKLLPDFPVLRFDKDHQDDLTEIGQGKSAIIVGTQALLTQEAPPDLALIGITLADTWLNVSDFRASERYHRLLRHLSEWHPIHSPLLLVQTFQAEHPALNSVLKGDDSASFPTLERTGRAALRYPPFARLAQIEVTAKDPEKAQQAAQALALSFYNKGAQEAELLGPTPSPISRLRGRYPYHLLLRVRDEERLCTLLSALDHHTGGGRIRVDVHPRGELSLTSS